MAAINFFGISENMEVPKRQDTLIQDLDCLLGYLCVRYGFCTQLGGVDLVEGGSLSSDEFASAVISAEGMNPAHEIKWYRLFKRYFSARYGNQVSEESFHNHIQ